MSSPVWLITGCSSGFGASLALLALRNGHRVIATSRTPSKSPELVLEVEKMGGKWLALDVCASNIADVMEEAIQIYGKIDILVNNAAYALLGAFETFSDQEARDQMDTNFFGPMALTRLVIPAMRKRLSGTIVNMSSAAGIEAKASRSQYCASKFALEAFSESLYHEMKPFGVRVLTVEPGAFRSKFAENVVLPKKELPEEYKDSVTELTIQAVQNMASLAPSPGDVEKGVQAIFDVVVKTGQAEGMDEYIRLPLGKDNAAAWERKLDDLRRNLDGTEKIWSNTDHKD